MGSGEPDSGSPAPLQTHWAISVDSALIYFYINISHCRMQDNLQCFSVCLQFGFLIVNAENTFHNQILQNNKSKKKKKTKQVKKQQQTKACPEPFWKWLKNSVLIPSQNSFHTFFSPNEVSQTAILTAEHSSTMQPDGVLICYMLRNNSRKMLEVFVFCN